MKTISVALQNHIASADISLAYCVKLVRTDGVVMGFTDHDEDLVVDGVAYKASTGVFRNALTNANKFNVANQELQGFLDSDEITEVDLRAGVYQDARLSQFLVNWQDLTQGIIKLPGSGWLGQVTLKDPLGYTATVLGLMQAYQPNAGNLYSPDCRNDLGDNFCKVNLDDFRQAGKVVSILTANYKFTADPTGDPFVTTTKLAAPAWQAKHRYYPGEAMTLAADSTYFYVCVQTNSYNNGDLPISGKTAPTPASAEGETITDNDIFWKATLHDWYFDGRLVWTMGANVGFNGEIRAYTVGTPATFELQSPTPFPIATDDEFTVEAGCGKQFYECRAKFNNALNHNGEPYAPGQDAFLDYPDQNG